MEEHVVQEKFVSIQIARIPEVPADLEVLQRFYTENKNSSDPVVLLNFLYGEAAALSLGHKALGTREAFAGYKFAAYLDKSY